MNAQSLLLVEDDLDDIELLLTELKRNGVDRGIIVRRDGCEAMEFLEDSLSTDPPRLPALIITDIKMPRMTGLEMLRRIRENPRLKSLCIVILTNSNNENDRAEALRWGARLFLQKPANYQQFGKVIRQIKAVLNGERA